MTLNNSIHASNHNNPKHVSKFLNISFLVIQFAALVYSTHECLSDSYPFQCGILYCRQ